MQYTRLGNTGLEVSRVCLGCMSFGSRGLENRNWAIPEEAARPIIKKALDGGINFFDTANVYSEGSSEEITGKLLWEMVPRDQVVLATKVYGRMRPGPNGNGISRKTIMHEVDESLRRLGTDYIDLYQIHRLDHRTPFEETLEALNDLVRAGKVRYIGASSMYAWQFMKMIGIQRANGWAQFVSMQNHVNLIHREEEREMLPLCLSEGIGVIPWSPLGRGKLTRPWGTTTHRSETDGFGRNLYDEEIAAEKIVNAVSDVAKQKDIAMAQVALAWLLQKPMIAAPIVGATKPENLDDVLAAVDITLSNEEIEQLEAPYIPVKPAGFS
jgi:aryl-alcohol dehydrogenase-like predicted oxidoreductase